MYVFKEREKMDFKDFGTIDQEFNSVIDDLFIEEEILSDADKENKSSRISLKFLNHIVKQMILQRKNRTLKDDIISPDVDEKRVVITMGKSEMIKTAFLPLTQMSTLVFYYNFNKKSIKVVTQF